MILLLSKLNYIGMIIGWCDLMIQHLSSTMYSPFMPKYCKEVEVCRETVAPVAMPVICSR